MKPNQADRDKIANLLLSDPTNGEDCFIMTPIEPTQGTALTFETVSKSSRYKITIEIEELV